jgi:cobalt-zinc-cadmium efflux system outer membrane protein
MKRRHDAQESQQPRKAVGVVRSRCQRRRVGALGALILAAVSVSACAHYVPEPVSAPTNAARLQARSLHDARLRRFLTATLPPQRTRDGPNANWNLATLTLAALYFHPDLDVARSRVAVARAAIGTAGQRPNPTLNLSPFYNLSIAHPTPWTIGSIVEFVIETAGKRSARQQQARSIAESARFDFASSGWQVRAHVRTALLELWAAQRRHDLARQRLALQNQLVTLLQQRFAAGEASSLDLTRERINQAQIALSERQLNGARGEARAELAAAIGVPDTALEHVAIEFTEFEGTASVCRRAVSSMEFRRRALVGRADVMSSLAEYQAAEAALKLQIANQYPNLSIGPGYNWGAIETNTISNQIGMPISLELPLLNHNQGPVAEALAKRREAASRFNAVQAHALGEIDAAVAACHSAQASLATAQSLLAGAQAHRHQVERAFRAGEVDRPTLVNAGLEALSVESSHFDTLLAERRAAGALEDALQKPLFDPALLPTEQLSNPREAHVEVSVS